MPDRDASGIHGLLNTSGLSDEEVQWLASGGSDGPASTWVREGGLAPALWIALGFLTYEVFKSLNYLLSFALYCISPSGSMRSVSALVYVVLCGMMMVLAYGVSSGRLARVIEELSRRYTQRTFLMRDLAIAAIIFIFSPVVVQSVSLYMERQWETSLGALALQLFLSICYRALPWIVCIRILGYVLPAKMATGNVSPAIPSFDEDEAIAGWRAHLLKCEGVSEEDALELVEHLREEMAALTQAGLPANQAFAVACRRLGPPETLSSEYAKAQPDVVWRTRAQWMLSGILATLLFMAAKQSILLLLFGMVRLLHVLPWAPTLFLPVADILMWATGFYLFTCFVNGRLTRFTGWLNRRHSGTRALATDLAFLAAVIVAVHLLYMLAWNSGKFMPVGSTLVMLVNAGLPLFVLAGAALCWIRPAAPSQVCDQRPS